MKNSGRDFKIFLLSMMTVFILGLSAIYAEMGGETPREHAKETTLLQGPPDVLPIRKFQAEERRTFFRQLSEARTKLAKEWDAQEHNLKEEQRLAREEARPRLTTVDDRREFLTQQRHVMTVFKQSRRQARRELIMKQKAEIKEFLAKQKTERRR